jgi:hypothetical protein
MLNLFQQNPFSNIFLQILNQEGKKVAPAVAGAGVG